MACNISKASPLRTSPITIRSGRIRKELRTKSRKVTSPLPSILAGRVSKRNTCGSWSCNSAESSRVMMRSLFGIKLDMAFSKVVLPEPVPPDINMFNLDLAAALRNSAI